MSFQWKPYEPLLHGCMGFLSQFVNGRWWWLERRERGQLPPENDRYPVIRVRIDSDGNVEAWLASDYDTEGLDEYWSNARVMDTLNDSRQYDQGGTLGWFAVVGLAFALGWWLG